MWKLLLFIYIFTNVICTLPQRKLKIWKNNQPIIGILVQETTYSLESVYPGQYKSFIPASYVKFLEGAGARVVPVWIGREKEYYEDVVNKTNGIFFPGGTAWFNESNGFAQSGFIVYRLAKEANNRGEFFPVFGVSQGMELMVFAESNGYEYRVRCSAQNVALPLEFKPGFRKNKMFKYAEPDILAIFSTKNVTPHFHNFCITEDNLRYLNIADQWVVNSLNKDLNDLEFISSIESKRYPFFGIHFHPEKVIYEWKPREGIIHNFEAVMANQFIASLFVNSARDSHHRYSNRKQEQRELIWNYPVLHTGLLDGSSYEQCYLFTSNEHDAEDSDKILDAVDKVINLPKLLNIYSISK